MRIFRPNIEKLKKKNNIDKLIEILQYDRDNTIRCAATKALGELKCSKHIEYLIERLTVYSYSIDEDLKKCYIDALVEIGSPAVIHLIEILKKGTSKESEKSAEILDMMEWNPTKSEKIYYHISKKQWNEILKIGTPTVHPITHSFNRFDNQTKIQAIKTLGKLGNEKAVKSIILLIRNIESYQWGEIRDVLLNIGETAVIPLIESLKDKNGKIRCFAIDCLSKIGDPRALEYFIKTLNDRNKRVQKKALKALDKMKWTPQNEMEKESYLRVKRSIIEPSIENMRGYTMVKILSKLCHAYMRNDTREIKKLEPIATKIGEELNRRGGKLEMLRVYDKLGGMPGSRTLDMHWNGIGNWRG